MISNKTLMWIAAAEAHAFIALSVVLASAALSSHFPWWAPPVVLLVVATLKETLFDPRNEENQPFLWAGATDLFFYVTGTAAGVLFIALAA